MRRQDTISIIKTDILTVPQANTQGIQMLKFSNFNHKTHVLIMFKNIKIKTETKSYKTWKFQSIQSCLKLVKSQEFFSLNKRRHM